MAKCRVTFAVLIILLMLSGGSAKITSGEVTKKEFSPAHTEVRIIPLVMTNGKTTHVITVPYFYTYPDRWYVTIEAWDNKSEKMLRATYRVTKNVYDAVDIGCEFVYDKTMEPTEPEYTRERQD